MARLASVSHASLLSHYLHCVIQLLVVYGAAQEEGKLPFLTELSKFCSESHEPLIIGGDFNIIRYLKEKKGDLMPNGVDGFSRLCLEVQLV